MKDLREGADERLLEKIARMIPGYGGYKDKELRREADKLQRAYLARKLQDEKARLDSVKAEMTDRMFLDLLGHADRTARRLEKLMDRIRFASYGYAGFFDLVKVKEEELDRIYEYDASLLDGVGKISEKLGELEAGFDTQADAMERIEELNKLIGEMDGKLNEREDMLRGMK